MGSREPLNTPPSPEAKPDPQPSQQAVYSIYLQLQSMAAERFHGSLAGKLIATAGFGLDGMELALASTIAGAAFLGIEPDPQRLKAAIHNASCDFMVNTLDEALRVLKNELRKHKPLSVGLLGDAAEVVPAMVERGVQPDMLSETSSMDDAAHRAAWEQLHQRGARIIRIGGVPPDTLQDGEIFDVVWTAANPQDLQSLDRLALELLPSDDRIRHRWLEQAPACFYRQLPRKRVLSLRQEELNQLLEACRSSTFARSLQAPATVSWENAAGTQQSIQLVSLGSE